jgi:LemA protein
MSMQIASRPKSAKMKLMKKSTIVTLVILAIIVIWSLSSYNSLVSQREVYTAQWSQVENQYQRRFDLIPNLVNTVKGAQGQELEVFGAIAEARTRYSGAQTQEEKVQATSQVESALGRLLVITESYPDLKSNAAIQDLLVQLEGTENRVSVERQKYNEFIRDYNLSVQRIPGSLFAKVFGFNVQPYFESTQGSDVVPTVDFKN